MKEISVELIDKMGSDKRICNVARVSFAKWDNEESITAADKGLLTYLASGLPQSERGDWEKVAKAHTHFTPFCHAMLSVRVTVPIFVARQLHKHTVGLVINEESRRYITEQVCLFIPHVVHKSPTNAKQGASKELHTSLLWSHNDETGDVHTDAVSLIKHQTEQAVEVYNRLLDAGVAPEEARMVLPLNTMVTWIWSGSLFAFNRVYQQRIDTHAQKTGTQEFAEKLGKILYEHFPYSMEALNYGSLESVRQSS